MSNLTLYTMDTTELSTLVYEFRRLSDKRPNETLGASLPIFRIYAI